MEQQPAAEAVEATLARLDGVTSPEQLIDLVASILGKPVRVESVGDASWGNLTGLLVETPTLARIFVRATDPAIYRLHCILHEIGHLVLHHAACTAETLRSGRGNVAPGQILTRGRLLIDGSAASEEMAAEAVAFVLAQRLLANGVHANNAFGI